MGVIRKGLVGWLRVLASPVARPAKDIHRAASSVRETAAAAREQRAERAGEAKEIQQLLASLSPEDKFQNAYEAWKWDESALARQLVAARRARIAALLTGTFGFVAVLAVIHAAHGVFVLLLGAAAIVLVTGAVVQALRFAWWEYGIESRSLISLREFLARPDLLSRLLRLRRRA